MNSDRRNELIKRLRQQSESKGIAYIPNSPAEARDILDLLNAEPEDALPWKVHHHFDLVAAFDDRERAETYLKGEHFAGRYTVTGPDTPLPDVHGGQRAPYEAEADPDGSPDWPPARLADTPAPGLVEITGPIYRLEVDGG